MGRVFFNTRLNVHSLTADYQALASDSNKVFMLNKDSGLTLTLPAVADAQDDAGHTTITFQGTPTKGDKLRIFCDGTNYYASGVTQDDGGVVLA